MPWEDVAENSNSDDIIPTFWDTVDVKPKDVTMALIDCPHCQRRLRVPEDYVGRLTCASCSKEFHRPNEQNEQNQNNLYDRKGRVAVVTNAQRRAGITNPGKQVAQAATMMVGFELVVYMIAFLVFIIFTITTW
jgi:DNA-directed RNA polymerase subunit RPC12/RpoP